MTAAKDSRWHPNDNGAGGWPAIGAYKNTAFLMLRRKRVSMLNRDFHFHCEFARVATGVLHIAVAKEL